MGKAGRWLRSFLAGKKGGRPYAEAKPVTVLPGATPKEKRWSFRRPILLAENQTPEPPPGHGVPCEAGPGVYSLSASETAEFDQDKHSVAVAVAAAAAADVAVAAAQAAATVVRLTSSRKSSLVEEAAAVRIQATFRGYLARAALCALRGIVMLQALVRGQLVRKQAKATLRCMQALLAAQPQLRAQRMRILQEHPRQQPPPPPRPRPSPQHPRQRRSYEMDRSCEDNAKIVEVDSGEPARRGAGKGGDRQQYSPVDYHYVRCSPAPSAMTELSPRASSGHLEEVSSFGFGTAHSRPRNASAATEPAETEPAASELFPSYMGNTKSSRAKARSQSAPRQRADAPLERQPSRRKGAEHRSVPRGARMQRSSSQSQQAAAPRASRSLFGPWSSSSAKLDSSTASLKDSECGSTSSVLTSATVYSRTRSLVGFQVRRSLY